MLRKLFHTFTSLVTLSWVICLAIVFLDFNLSLRELTDLSRMSYEQRRLLMKFDEITFSLTTTLETVIAMLHMSFIVFYTYLREIVLSCLTITTFISGDGQGILSNTWIVFQGIFEILDTILRFFTGDGENFLKRVGLTIFDNINLYRAASTNASKWFNSNTLSTDSSEDSTLPPLEPDPRCPFPQGPQSAPVEYHFVRPSPSSSLKHPSTLLRVDSQAAALEPLVDPDSLSTFVFDPVFGVIPREVRDLWNQSETAGIGNSVNVDSGHDALNDKSMVSDSFRNCVPTYTIPVVRGSYYELSSCSGHRNGLDEMKNTHES